tara:strand:+ start:49 stop:303 length:255 start_codon:yes stop_codon:yes gene_type:complete
MASSSKKYAIVDYSSITDAMIGQVLQDSESTCRRSVSGTDRAIVSWIGNKPTTLYGIDQYTHAQILSIVSDVDGDWYSDPDDYS